MSEQALTPYLVVSNAAAAIDFYTKALGFEEIYRHQAPGDTRLMHASLRFGNSNLMLSDDFCDKMGSPSMVPEKLGGSPVTLHLQVEDANAIWERAVAAGATVTMPLMDQFWGDRYGQFTDPFGHKMVHWTAHQEGHVRGTGIGRKSGL